MFITVLLFNAGCSSGDLNNERISETRFMFDTVVTLTIHGDVDRGLLDEAFLLCTELDKLFNMTLEGSDIWRINHAGGEAVQVDMRTIDVINAGLKFSEVSGGKFDITIGKLSRLWNFGENMNVPSDDEKKIASETIDYRLVKIEDNYVQLLNPDAWIDLGAIAKGYIAYQTAEFFAANGVSGALVEMGGDIVAVGNRPDGDPWRIALRKPFGESDDFLGIVEASWVSVLASGIYERQFEKDGILYHHILDPETGYPVVSDVVSAIVKTETAVLGEGLSTIAVLVGSEKAQTIFQEFQEFIGAVFVLDDGSIITFGDIDLIRK